GREVGVDGVEAGRGAGGVGGLRVDWPAAADLGGDAVGVEALEEVDDAAVVGLVAGAWGDLHAGVLELLGDTLEGGGIGRLPADELEVVAAVGAQLQAMVVLVHAEIGGGLVVAGDDLHAEDIGGEILPRLVVAGADPDVAELGDAGHRGLLSSG